MKNNTYDFRHSHGGTTPTNETTAAKLAVLGGILSTLGDGISTMAAALALEELRQQQDQNNDQIRELEKQIKILTREMDQLKK